MSILKYKIILLIHQNKRLLEISEELGISQPTVTFHIKSLEENLGIKLVHNKNKYLSLTEAAKSLLPYIIQIIELENTLQQKAQQYKHFELGSIVVGSTLAPSISILPELIANFTKSYKHLHISLETASTSSIIENVASRKYDIGIVSSNIPLPSYLISKHFSMDQLVLVYPSKLKSEFEQNNFLKLLSNYNFIHHATTSSTRKAVDCYLTNQGIELTSSITVNSIEVIKELIKKEIGISILPISLIQSELDTQLFSFIKLDSPELNKEVQLIYHKDTYLSPIILAFISFLPTL